MAADSRQDTLTPQLQVGDRVLGACRFGSFTTCLNVPEQQVQFTAHRLSTPAPCIMLQLALWYCTCSLEHQVCKQSCLAVSTLDMHLSAVQ